jgi:hypothetical protein
MKMTSILVSGAFALAIAVAFAPTPVQAAGCLEGAAVGGATGHFMGHHTLLGAGAGCLIGRHEEYRHGQAYWNEREDSRQEREYGGGR